MDANVDMTQHASHPARGDALAPHARDADPLRSLFDAARAGDAQALTELCRAMRPRLYRVAYAVLRDRDDADDIAQDALVRALHKRWLFLGIGSVGGWMTRIALNLAKNRHRDVARRHHLIAGASDACRAAYGAQATALPDALGVMVSREATQRADAALAVLTAKQADVVRLRVVAELSFADVAVALGMREDNARVTFNQAKDKLKRHLDAQTHRSPQ